MIITVKYIDNDIDKELEMKFIGFEFFGVWVADNYDTIKLIDVIQEF